MSIEEIKSSGLLEMYVIGELSEAKIKTVEDAILKYPQIQQEIHEIELALETYAMMHSIPADPTLKPMLLATVDYHERTKAGEKPSIIPSLSEDSTIADFAQWLDRKDIVEPEHYESMHGRIIGADDNKTTLIVWLKDGAPDETHTDEIEKFLIVEGSCNIIIGQTTHSLIKGDFIAIPLHISHRVEVTSNVPCKIILQREAA